MRVHAAGHRLFYRQLGKDDRTPVVLVHGFVISHRYHLPLARILARRHRVLLPDLPGFGRSSKPRDALGIDQLADALVAWMRALGIARAHLVGNSMGCQVAAAAAERHPEAVATLTLLGPTVDPEARTALAQAVRLARDIPRERASLPWIHVPDYIRCGPRRIVQTARRLLKDVIEEREVRAPTLVLRGDRDALVSERFALSLVERWPDARYKMLPGSPHAANYSAPGLAAEAIEAFLAEQDRDASEKGLEAHLPPPSVWRPPATSIGHV